MGIIHLPLRCKFKIILTTTSFVLFFTLSSCYRHPHLNAETAGSLTASVGGGLAAASQASGNLIFIGGGIVAGSVIGGIIGSAYDDQLRDHQLDPALWPIDVDCYQTRRPLYRTAFCPGIAVPPDKINKNAILTWKNYSF